MVMATPEQLRKTFLEGKTVRQPRTVVKTFESFLDLKTKAMWQLEAKSGRPVEQLVLDSTRTLRDIAEELGVSESTVCKWRKRLSPAQVKVVVGCTCELGHTEFGEYGCACSCHKE